MSVNEQLVLPDLPARQRDMLLSLTDEYIWQLRRLVREQEALSVPCPPGHWRWADSDTSGYRRKSEEELRQDRARALKRAAEARTQLQVALETRRVLEP